MKRHEPKPEIEYHPHIQMLIDSQEKRSADRTLHRNKEKELEERNQEIQGREPYGIIEFFCDECNEDFANFAHKHTEIDWSNPNQQVAYYKSKHDCGNWVIRNITDKNRDAYWSFSERVAQDRGKHHNSLLQSFETGYELLYGRKNT